MGLLHVLGLTPPLRTAPGSAIETGVPASAGGSPGAGGAAASSGRPGTGAAAGSAGTATLIPPISTAPTSSDASAAAAAALAYAAERAAIQMLVLGLKTHAQQGRIGDELKAIDTLLAQADAAALAGTWPAAQAVLVQARAACVAAKTLADDWTAFAKARASADGVTTALRGFAPATVIGNLQAIIAGADHDVASKPPAFGPAMAKLNGIDAAIRPSLTSEVATLKARLVRIDAMDAKVKAYLAPTMADSRALVTACEAALAASSWSECIRTKNVASRILGPAERLGTRRAEYETKRAAAETAIAPVRTNAATRPRAAELDAQLAQAATLASNANRDFATANRLLDATAQRAGVIASIAPTIAGHDSERRLADTELAALDAHAAAKRVEEARTSVRQQLQAESALVALIPGGNDPATGWRSALVAVQRARADLAAAKKLADSLAASVAADGAAAKPADLGAIGTALAALRTDATAARKAPHAAVADAAFKVFDKRAADADKALAKKDGKAAATALAAASTALVDAKAMQAEHAQFATALPAAEAELKALQALANAKILAPRIDPVKKAIDEAKARDKAHDGAAAMAAARRALDAAAAARRDDAARIAFATDSKALGTAIDALADAKAKAAQKKSLADADKLADALKFAEASTALKKLELKADESKLRAITAANPADPAIVALASKMTEAGGGGVIDEMLQKLPEDAASKQLLVRLAEGRFGVAFTPDAGAASAQEMKTMKRLCKMFAKVPNDIRGNTSITGVSHADGIENPGGDHSPDTAQIKMTGRPDEKKLDQQFGSKQVAPDPTDPAGKKTVAQLPADVDPACKPADEKPIDFLNFAALHEVGHGVDDAKGVMRQHMTEEAYGGWVVYGASVKPIADLVGPHFAFYSTPEQKKYVLDKLASQPATPPPVPPTPGDWAKRKQDFDRWVDLATSANVYRRQGDCEKLEIQKRVYHEAYPREWVSYSAAARKKGLTGYQFRAPSEWFAELYAGFHSGKLGKSHPARVWLAKL